jgi:hypothetical protein
MSILVIFGLVFCVWWGYKLATGCTGDYRYGAWKDCRCPKCRARQKEEG